MTPLQPSILFGRTKLTLAAIAAGQSNKPVLEAYVPLALSGIDTVVVPFDEQFKPNLDIFEYIEVLAVNVVMVSASPVAVKDEEEDGVAGGDEDDSYDDYTDDEWPAPTEERQSAEIERVLSLVGFIEEPSFGRRILLVSYNQALPERDMQRIKDRVRKRLGTPTVVWQGRSFEGYCFVDNRTPDHIISPLRSLLDCDEINDYLLVQPTRMVLEDKSGLSPLGDRMHVGWKKQPIRTNSHDRRTGRYGQTG